MDSWEQNKEPRGCVGSLYWTELSWPGNDETINWALPCLHGFHCNSRLSLSTHEGGTRQQCFSERRVPKAGVLAWPSSHGRHMLLL